MKSDCVQLGNEVPKKIDSEEVQRQSEWELLMFDVWWCYGAETIELLDWNSDGKRYDG